MSLFKRKDKLKDKELSRSDLKAAKPKKPKIHDIWEACEQGSLEGLLKVLKKKGGMAQINEPNQDGRWPIHIAAGGGHVDIAELLLENGAQCNMIENTEARWNVLHWAVNSRNFQMMKLIASQTGLKPDFRGPSSGTSRMDRNAALHHFARMFEEDPEGIINLIIQRGGNINIVNSQGDTPLHVAVTYRHGTIARILLANGANPNSQNDRGETPLHLAARYGPESVVKLMLKSGGNVAIVGAHGMPMDVAATATIRALLTPSSPTASSTTSSTDASSIASSSSAPNVQTTPAVMQRMPSKKYHWTVDFNEIALGPKIGSGGFGIVYKGTWRGIDVAVKCLKSDADLTEDDLNSFLHEVTVMSRLRHQNILLFVGACLQEPNICFLTEYIPHGNLRQVLDKERLQPLKKLNMAIEATRGLTYLHSQVPPILHRDLKSANVLVDDNYHIKLADFGLSRSASLYVSETLAAQVRALSLSKSPCRNAMQIEEGAKPQLSTSAPTSSISLVSPATNRKKKSKLAASSTLAQKDEQQEQQPQKEQENPSKQEATDDSPNATRLADTASNSTEETNPTTDFSIGTPTLKSTQSAPVGALTSINTTSSSTSTLASSSIPSRLTSSSSSTALQPAYLDLLDQAGTLYTSAPEVLNGAEYTKEADIYALGIIFWELATEKIPFEGMSQLKMLRAIVEDTLPVPTEMGPLFGELIQDMLSKDPTKRPSLTEIAERLKAVRTQLGEGR